VPQVCHEPGALTIRRAHGAQVTLLGRARFIEPVAQGMGLTDLDGMSVRVGPDRFRLATHASCLADADIVLVCVKGSATAAAAAELARFTRPGTTVVSFQNGVRNAETLEAFAPHCRVVPGMVPFNVMQPTPVHWHRATEGQLYASPHPQVEALRPYLAACNLSLQSHPDMRAVLWSKLLLNLNNAVNALSGATLQQELRDRDHRLVVAACVDEALLALRVMGIEPAQIAAVKPASIPRLLRLPSLLYSLFALPKLKIDAQARSSMAEDLARGRATEVDEINGAVVRLAAERGVPAPVNQRLIELVRAAEAGDGRRFSGQQLRALVGV
jgi:2-dehydropantoate 2-reductase